MMSVPTRAMISWKVNSTVCEAVGAALQAA